MREQPAAQAHLRQDWPSALDPTQHGRVVDPLCEDPGRLPSPRLPECEAVQLRPHEQFVHARPTGDRLELADPPLRADHAVRDRLFAEGIEAVAENPQVGVRHPHATHPSVVEPSNPLAEVAVHDLDQADAARPQPLPARIADLAAEGKRGLEGVAAIAIRRTRWTVRSRRRVPMSEVLAVMSMSLRVMAQPVRDR